MKNLNKNSIVAITAAFLLLFGLIGPVTTYAFTSAEIANMSEQERQTAIVSVKTELISVIQQLIGLLQAQIAAMQSVPGFPDTGFAPK